MKNKLGLLVLVVFIALASIGMSYADDKFIQVFGPVTAWDNEGIEDVGVVIAYPYQDDVVVTISNAYPGYEAYVTFTIIYISDGTDPIYVDAIDIHNTYAGTEMDVVVTDLNGIGSLSKYPPHSYVGKIVNHERIDIIFCPDERLEGIFALNPSKRRLNNGHCIVSFSVT